MTVTVMMTMKVTDIIFTEIHISCMIVALIQNDSYSDDDYEGD